MSVEKAHTLRENRTREQSEATEYDFALPTVRSPAGGLFVSAQGQERYLVESEEIKCVVVGEPDDQE